MLHHSLNDQEIARRESLHHIEALGVNPYPAPEFKVSHFSVDIKNNFTEEPLSHQGVSLAGRLMSQRGQGKAIFAELQDSKGRIQIYFKRDDFGEEAETIFDKLIAKNLHLGDFIGIEGDTFRTRMGEITVRVMKITFLGKALRPLPVVKKDADGVVYDAFSDHELRARQRYVDLLVNEGVKETFLLRSKMIKTIRDYLDAHEALEVDTPVLQNIPGGAAARPFITHHNALDIPMYLRIANELYLKRLIVGGFDFVYEFSRNFRNEGIDRTHNPEFTILEFYVAYKDYFWMMDFTEKLLEKVALTLHGTTEVQVGEKTINFKAPFRRVTIFEAIQENTGIDISQMQEEELRAVCKKLHIETDATMGKGKLIDEIFGETSEANFIQPTFITDYPVEMSPLTKKHRSKPGLVERFELMVNGKEIANAYSELNDPIDQRERFEEQGKLMERGDDEAMFIDHDFLRALEYGMPPTSGIGIGIDRLAMLMTNQVSIQEVLFFPHLRPEKA